MLGRKSLYCSATQLVKRALRSELIAPMGCWSLQKLTDWSPKIWSLNLSLLCGSLLEVLKFFYVKIMSSFLNFLTKMISVKCGFPQIRCNQQEKEQDEGSSSTQIENEIKLCLHVIQVIQWLIPVMAGYQKWEMDNQWLSGWFSKIHKCRAQKKSNNQFKFINAVLQNLKTKRFLDLRFVFKTRTGGY